jgi:hypothetical protein
MVLSTSIRHGFPLLPLLLFSPLQDLPPRYHYSQTIRYGTSLRSCSRKDLRSRPTSALPSFLRTRISDVLVTKHSDHENASITDLES